MKVLCLKGCCGAISPWPQDIFTCLPPSVPYFFSFKKIHSSLSRPVFPLTCAILSCKLHLLLSDRSPAAKWLSVSCFKQLRHPFQGCTMAPHPLMCLLGEHLYNPPHLL